MSRSRHRILGNPHAGCKEAGHEVYVVTRCGHDDPFTVDELELREIRAEFSDFLFIFEDN